MKKTMRLLSIILGIGGIGMLFLFLFSGYCSLTGMLEVKNVAAFHSGCVSLV